MKLPSKSQGLCKVLIFKLLGSRTHFRAAASGLISSAILLGLPFVVYSQPYTFTTLAGTPGITGTNDGLNQSAQFSFPVGVVCDGQGALFVADFLNHSIRKMTPAGTNWMVTTIAGLPGTPGYADGTNSEARFNRPAGIALDTAGNLFVAERYNHTIRQITPSGTNWVVSTVAGLGTVTGANDGTNSDARFYLPSGIVAEGSNHLFVADSANFTVREITAVGTNWVVTTIAGTALSFGFTDGVNAQAQFNFPYGIALSSADKLYVADSGNNAIREMTRSGANWLVATVSGFSGNPGNTDGAGSIAAFNFPTGIAADRAGNLYVADQSNNSIRKITTSSGAWTVSTMGGQAQHPGSVDGTSTNALFKKPWGLTVDLAGNVFVADYSNST